MKLETVEDLMTAGRPRKPIEQKRKTGRTPNTDSGGRKLPEVASVTILPMADGIPTPPMDLGIAGRELWENGFVISVVEKTILDVLCPTDRLILVLRRPWLAVCYPKEISEHFRPLSSSCLHRLLSWLRWLSRQQSNSGRHIERLSCWC